MNIQEVRAKYPQYGDMTDADLAKALHSKFYADMPYNQFAAKIGLGMGPRDVPDSTPEAEKPKPKEDTRTFAQRADAWLTGAGEAGAAMLTGGISGLAGRAVALGGIATGGTGETGVRIAQEGTYQPKTEEGKAALEAIGRTVEATGVAGLGPTAGLQAGTVAPAIAARQAAASARQATGFARRVVGKAMEKDIPDEGFHGDMAGVGSAVADPATVRRERAASLPVPIKLTQGQATRDFAQQQFEREAAKNPRVGDPMRQRFSDQNERILQNFDAWIDQTGAEAGSLRATGEVVTNAVVAKSHRAKADINAAYTAARNSGEMRERIDAGPLRSYLDEHQAEAINAPVLTSVEAKLSRIVSQDGGATINDLEEVRKMVGRLSGKDATNALFGREVKGVIDQMTEGKGGDLYKKARSLRQRYAQEFEDHAIVEKLLAFKPGTKDRAVAFEDVFGHSILKGSLDDVRIIRKTLQTAGPQGEQAWRELQGATIGHIRDEITKNVQIDQAGNRVISPARLDRLVTELDKDGKLDFLFGKQGAQQIRDVNGIAQDAFTAPPGSVNHANTASILTAALDKVAGKVTGVPFAGSVANYAARESKDAAMRKRVREALK